MRNGCARSPRDDGETEDRNWCSETKRSFLWVCLKETGERERVRGEVK